MLPDPMQMLIVRHALERSAQDKLHATVLYGETSLCDGHPSAEFAFHDSKVPNVRFIVSVIAVEEVSA
jgi:hypothetical protein